MLRAVDKLQDECMKSMLNQGSKLDRLAKQLQDLPGCAPVQPERISVLQMNTAPNASKTIEPQVADSFTSHKKPKLQIDDVDTLLKAVESLNLANNDLTLLFSQQRFLSSLNYLSRPLRHSDISTAHNKTFQWILNASCINAHKKRSDQSSFLIEWLRYGTGTFWISGKAGSGKSTLIKFIVNSHDTRKALQYWAGPKSLVIASHYFWASGTPMQKSQQGLLRSLLYDICCECPEIISSIFPHEWSIYKSGIDFAHEWSNRELLDALSRLGQLPESKAQTKYCVFIDGVDEFDGDHFDLCQILKGLSASSSFKCCLSSRPWNVFEDAFGQDQSHKICVHDLTRLDIKAYTRSRLLEHPRLTKVAFPLEQMDLIVNQVTQRAQGVFLWAFLVTRSLRDGLVNGDTIIELQQRLDSIPSNLETLFKHMLDEIDSHYHKKMARVLRVAMNANQPLALHFYRIRDYEEDDEDYALNKSTETQKPRLLVGALEQYRKRINAQSGGLLEINDDSNVQFLHRTVRDFLLTQEMNDYLCQKSGSDFMVNISILKTFVFLFRCWWHNAIWLIPPDQPFCTSIDGDDKDSDDNKRLSNGEVFWQECLPYANDAIVESSECAMMYLDYIADLYTLEVPSLYSLGFDKIRCTNGLCIVHPGEFITPMLKAGVDQYFSFKFPDNSELSSEKRVLRYEVMKRIFDQSPWTDGHINIIVKCLDWNDKLAVADGWKSLFRQTCLASCPEADNNLEKAIKHGLFLQFLKHGASRNTHVITCVTDSKSHASQQDDTPRGPLMMFLNALFYYKGVFNYALSKRCFSVIEEFLNSSLEDIELQLDAIRERVMAYYHVCLIPYVFSPLERTYIVDFDSRAPCPTMDPVQLRFFGQIAQMLVKKGIEIEMEIVYLEALAATSLAFFPGNVGENLATLIRTMKTEEPHVYSRKAESGTVYTRDIGRIDK